MMLPVILAALQDILWYSALPLAIFVLPSGGLGLATKIMLCVSLVIFFSILYAPFVILLLWRKHLKQQIPENILQRATLREKVKFISKEVSWL